MLRNGFRVASDSVKDRFINLTEEKNLLLSSATDVRQGHRDYSRSGLITPSNSRVRRQRLSAATLPHNDMALLCHYMEYSHRKLYGVLHFCHNYYLDCIVQNKELEV
jgi:hypothetical protein